MTIRLYSKSLDQTRKGIPAYNNVITVRDSSPPLIKGSTVEIEKTMKPEVSMNL